MLSQIRQCNTYTGLGQHDMLYNTGASRTRYLKFLKMLKNKKIITFKITNLLKKNIDNNILDIIDKKNMDKKYNFLKIKIIILYIIFKNLIKNLNYIFYLFLLNFTTDKYYKLFKKINYIFKYYNYKMIILSLFEYIYY